MTIKYETQLKNENLIGHILQVVTLLQVFNDIVQPNWTSFGHILKWVTHDRPLILAI